MISRRVSLSLESYLTVIDVDSGNESQTACYKFIFSFVDFLGDDWEHEEIFTDDDEAVGNDPEEREDLAPEVPAPPEIKQVCFFHAICQFYY